MSDPTKELIFQNEVVAQMVAGGWKRGRAENYDRALALYPEDVIGFVKETQPEQWEKFCTLYPSAPE
jgi:type I restriction enzyme R subunit